jgi:hypothetical protein
MFGAPELRTMGDHLEAQAAELREILLADEAELRESLPRRLGEALLGRGVGPNQILKEWDKNGDGNLSKIEFKQAVRLSLQLRASNDEVDAMFDMLDKDGDGSLDVDAERARARPLTLYCAPHKVPI